MEYLIFLMSGILVVCFIGLSCKPSPIYGGVCLIIGGGVGCGIVVGLGGSFLGLIMFLVYLGGMMVVFGYTTAMATEEYPEVWVSNISLFYMVVFGVMVEFCGWVVMLKLMEFGSIYGSVDVVVFGNEVVMGLGNIGGDSTGVSYLFDFGSWLLVLGGWALFISVFIVMEVTRGF